MFLKQAITQWTKGNITAVLPPAGHEDKNAQSLHGKTLLADCLVYLLTKHETQKIIDLARREAKSLRARKLTAALGKYELRDAQHQAMLETKFRLSNHNTLCVAVWDKPAIPEAPPDVKAGSSNELLIWMDETDIPRSVQRQMLEVVAKALSGTDWAKTHHAEPQIRLFDGTKRWGDMLLRGDNVPLFVVYRQWEIRIPLATNAAESLSDIAGALAAELATLKTNFGGTPFDVRFES